MATREKRHIPFDCWKCHEPIVDKRVYFSIHDPSSTDNIVTHQAEACKRAAVAHVMVRESRTNGGRCES